MPIIFTALYSFIGSVAGKFITDAALKFLAYKALLVTLITITLPAVLKSLMTWMLEGVLSIANGVDGIDSMTVATHSFSGLAGYFASNLMLPECVSIMLTACAIRFALNFIPFIG